MASVIFVVVIQKMWAECLMKQKSCITRAGTTWSDSFYELSQLHLWNEVGDLLIVITFSSKVHNWPETMFSKLATFPTFIESISFLYLSTVLVGTQKLYYSHKEYLNRFPLLIPVPYLSGTCPNKLNHMAVLLW